MVQAKIIIQKWCSPKAHSINKFFTKLAISPKNAGSQRKQPSPRKRLRHKAAPAIYCVSFCAHSALMGVTVQILSNSAIWHRKVSHTIKTVFFYEILQQGFYTHLRAHETVLDLVCR